MNLERRLAASSVRRSLRDYSVYFATLAFCACLLYTYASCSDTITALGSEAAVASGSDTLNRATAFIAPLGFFSVFVFCLLARYANRFLVRRRKHELATLMLVGLSRGAVARVLLRECGLVALMALAAGMGAGVLLSPAFGALAAWAFALPWHLTFVVSLPGIALAVSGFFLVMLVSAVGAVRELGRTSLADLMRADRESEASVVRSRGAVARDFVVGIVCLGLGYAICLTVEFFIILMVPMIVLVCFGTYLVLRSLATVIGDLLRASRVVYLRDLTCFVSRQLEVHVSASCSALTCVAALLAVGVCALGMAIGIRNAATVELASVPLEDYAEEVAYLGSFVYIILFFGITFLVAGVAVLALQQLSESSDNREGYAELARLGAGEGLLSRTLFSQVAAYFLVPGVVVVVHDAVGFVVADAILTQVFQLPEGSVSFPAVLASVLVVFAAYLALTYAACRRVVLPREA